MPQLLGCTRALRYFISHTLPRTRSPSRAASNPSHSQLKAALRANRLELAVVAQPLWELLDGRVMAIQATARGTREVAQGDYELQVQPRVRPRSVVSHHEIGRAGHEPADQDLQ